VGRTHRREPVRTLAARHYLLSFVMEPQSRPVFLAALIYFYINIIFISRYSARDRPSVTLSVFIYVRRFLCLDAVGKQLKQVHCLSADFS